jgi:hypothetical protein
MGATTMGAMTMGAMTMGEMTGAWLSNAADYEWSQEVCYW